MAYVPILKGKRGEFTALGQMEPGVQAEVHPIMEVVHDERLRDVMETFRKNAWSQLPQGLDIAVDCGGLWHHGVVGGVWTGRPMNWLSEAFGAWLLALIPVFRPYDPPGLLTEVRDVQRAHRRGAVLRVDVFLVPVGSSAMSREVRTALRAVHLAPEQVDLVLDAGHVSGDTAVIDAFAPMLDALRWARQATWRNVVLAAGAFPKTLRKLVRGIPNRMHRWDAALWRKVVNSTDGMPPHFGDYGVTHPVAPRRGRGSIPNIRYTVGEDWQVYVAPQTLPGNDDFFVIARELLRSEYWPARGEATSWGDAELARCARGQRAKAGGGAEWRAWATSHHLAVTAEALRTTGQP
ncbi:hypothetical protein DB35_02075 [Streptomyces abyssalis]|uniref:T4 beta protein n=1 Tax=Streptomyces abyssalis TaxID=933944 RepID=A0A1E7JR62_9ACTN|nr:beta family protein [Streptomyces abyssalis]OEU90724.1 hypothetical protein AN215_11225 [Streptomyces abyssalis]OEU95342.1 hypothetical protein DB35_02075 [Streptomyces abyssalis]